MASQYTTVLRLRMLPDDYAKVKARADAYRQPLSAFARNAICGIPMVCHLDEDAVEMLIRVGGLLLKHSRDNENAGWTAEARQEFLDLSHRLLGIASRIEDTLPDDGDGRESPC